MVAALPLLGVLIGATLQYAFGHRLESRKLLVALKGQAYSDFIRVTAESGYSRDTEKTALITDVKARICIYGSLNVVQRLRDFDRTGATAERPEGQTALMAVLSAMREDVTGKGFAGLEDTFRPLLFGKGQ